MTETAIYLDDLYVGQRFISGTYRMEETDIMAFAAKFDPQPFHLDRADADASVFRGLAARGWHTAAAFGPCGNAPIQEGDFAEQSGHARLFVR